MRHSIVNPARALLFMACAVGTAFGDSSFLNTGDGSAPYQQWINSAGDVSGYYSSLASSPVDNNAILANLLSYTIPGGSHNTAAPAPALLNYNVPAVNAYAATSTSSFDPFAAIGGAYNSSPATQFSGGDTSDDSLLMSLLSYAVPVGWKPPVIAAPVVLPQNQSIPVPTFQSTTAFNAPIIELAAVDVPEPGTWGMIGLGFVLLLLGARSKKSQAN